MTTVAQSERSALLTDVDQLGRLTAMTHLANSNKPPLVRLTREHPPAVINPIALRAAFGHPWLRRFRPKGRPTPDGFHRSTAGFGRGAARRAARGGRCPRGQNPGRPVQTGLPRRAVAADPKPSFETMMNRETAPIAAIIALDEPQAV